MTFFTPRRRAIFVSITLALVAWLTFARCLVQDFTPVESRRAGSGWPDVQEHVSAGEYSVPPTPAPIPSELPKWSATLPSPADGRGKFLLSVYAADTSASLSLCKIEFNDVEYAPHQLNLRNMGHRILLVLPAGSVKAGPNRLTLHLSQADDIQRLSHVILHNYRTTIPGTWMVPSGWQTQAMPKTGVAWALTTGLALLIGLSCWFNLTFALSRPALFGRFAIAFVSATHLALPAIYWGFRFVHWQWLVGPAVLSTAALAVTQGTGLLLLCQAALAGWPGRWLPRATRLAGQVRHDVQSFVEADDGRIRWLRESLVVVVLCLLPDAVLLSLNRSPIFADTVTSNLPIKSLAMEQLTQGQIPLWTSKLGCGAPLLADTFSLPFDWRNVWWLLLPAPAAYWAMLLSSRIVGALIGFYYFRVRHGFRFLAALLATLVYFGGTLYCSEARLHSTAVILEGLLGVIWLTERLLEKVNWRRALALSFAWALLFMMGSVAYLVYLPVLAGVWAVGLWWFSTPSNPGDKWRQLLKFSLAYAGAGIWALVLCGVTLLPLVELIRLSNRGGEYPNDPFAFRSLWFMIFGTHAGNTFVPPCNQFFYVGVLALPLILSSLFRRDNAYLRLLPWLSGATLLGVFILTSPLKPFLVQWFPFLATIAFFRLGFFWGFLAALLTGYALSGPVWQPRLWVLRTTRLLYLLQLGGLLCLPLLGIWMVVLYFEEPNVFVLFKRLVRQLIEPFLWSTFFLLIALRAWGLRLCLVRTGRRALTGMALVLAIELIGSWTMFVLTAGESSFTGVYPQTPEVAFLKDHKDPNYRTFQLIPSSGSNQPSLPTLNEEYSTLFLDAQTYHGLHTANAYHSLIPRDYSRLIEHFGNLEDRRALFPRAPNAVMTTSRDHSPLMDNLAVRYLITDQRLPPRDTLIERVKGSNYYVYERKNPMPRAYFVRQAERLPSEQVHERLQQIGLGDQSAEILKTSVFLDAKVPSENGPSSVNGEHQYVPAQISRDADAEVHISIEAPEDGYLVLSDVYYPGWIALVDGVQKPIEKANGFARAVAVEPGTHTVVFRYQPASWRNGLVLTLGGLSISLGVLLIAGLRNAVVKRRRQVPPPDYSMASAA